MCGSTGVRSIIQHLTLTRKGEGTVAWCEKAGDARIPRARGRSGRVYMVKADCLNPSHGGSSCWPTGANGIDACVWCCTGSCPACAELSPEPAHKEWENDVMGTYVHTASPA
jgi:hypothetical protein